MSKSIQYWKRLENGFNLGNYGERINLMKGSVTILFNRLVTSMIDFVPGIMMKPLLYAVNATVVESRKRKSKNAINISNLNQILGPYGKASARLTGKALCIGTFDTCEAYSIGKARQKNVTQVWKAGTLTAGERLYVDIISIQGVRFGGLKSWALIVNDYSGYCWSYFMKINSERNERLWTPQRSVNMERKLQTRYGMTQAMMKTAGIEDEFRKGLRAECASTALFYENVMVNEKKKMLPLELMFESKYKELNSLKRFGEMCAATTKAKIQRQAE